MKNLRKSNKNLRDKSHHRVSKLRERISGFEDKMKEMDSSVKENVKLKNSSHKIPGNLGHYEMTKFLNNKNRGRRRKPRSRTQKIFSIES